MRRLILDKKQVISLIVSLAVGIVSSPVLLLAEAGNVTGSVSGEARDALGRPLADVRIELVRAIAGRPGGRPLGVTSTDTLGGWSFDGVAPGQYVVRAVMRDQVIGVPVLLGTAQPVSGVILVAPSLAALGAAALQQGQDDEDDDDGLGAFWWTVIAAGAAGGITGAVLAVKDAS